MPSNFRHDDCCSCQAPCKHDGPHAYCGVRHCPFCGEPWYSSKGCGDDQPKDAGFYRMRANRRAVTA